MGLEHEGVSHTPQGAPATAAPLPGCHPVQLALILLPDNGEENARSE